MTDVPRKSDADHMRAAYECALRAREAGEVPVGAVLVVGDEIIGQGHNQPISTCDPTAHAEIVALRAACKALGNYRVQPNSAQERRAPVTLYVTLEPCIMCASAIIHARVDRVVFGAWDPKAGAAGSIIDVFRIPGLNYRVDVFGGVMAEECKALLQEFFSARRNGGG